MASLSFHSSRESSAMVHETRKHMHNLAEQCNELCGFVHPLFGYCEKRMSESVRQIGADDNTLFIRVESCATEVLAIAVAVLLQAPGILEVVVYSDTHEPTDIIMLLSLLQACRDVKVLSIHPQGILMHHTVEKNLRIEKN